MYNLRTNLYTIVSFSEAELILDNEWKILIEIVERLHDSIRAISKLQGIFDS